MGRIFILSPANSAGERARLLYHPAARFDLARRLQRGDAVPIGEIFSFLSGLYFRGKLAYALRFGAPPKGFAGAYIITSNRGLLPALEPLTLPELRDFAAVPIDPGEPRYVEPLRRDADHIARQTGASINAVLLGSISTAKYAEQLLASFGSRLLFPASFVGRGDMSRGSLLLRHAEQGTELEYLPVQGAVRRGKRPEKLPPRSWGYKVLSRRKAFSSES